MISTTAASEHRRRLLPSSVLILVFRIPIEHRPPLEARLVRGALYPFTTNAQGIKEQATVMVTPEDLEGVYNPSFDVTPAELITAIVTEKGVAVKAEGSKVFDLTNIV